jgi:hypothetical protein
MLKIYFFATFLRSYLKEVHRTNDRFHTDFLEVCTGFSMSISVLSNTVSLDTLCMRLDEAEFELFFSVFLFPFV